MDFKAALAGVHFSIAAGLLIAGLLIAFWAGLPIESIPSASVMAVLIVIAVLVYRRFSRFVRSRVFIYGTPITIAGEAVGVAAIAASSRLGVILVAAFYIGEPIVGYYVYKELRSALDAAWTRVFYAGALLYALTLPAAVFGLFYVPLAFDLIKSVALFRLRAELLHK